MTNTFGLSLPLALNAWTHDIGNPNLKPRLSDNFDLPAEYRLGGGFDGLLSVALFNKNIRNEIFTLANANNSFTYAGATYTAGAGAVITVTQADNTSSCLSCRATMSARHSLLASSMIVRMRNLRPSCVRPSTKS